MLSPCTCKLVTAKQNIIVVSSLPSQNQAFSVQYHLRKLFPSKCITGTKDKLKCVCVFPLCIFPIHLYITHTHTYIHTHTDIFPWTHRAMTDMRFETWNTCAFPSTSLRSTGQGRNKGQISHQPSAPASLQWKQGSLNVVPTQRAIWDTLGYLRMADVMLLWCVW